MTGISEESPSLRNDQVLERGHTSINLAQIKKSGEGPLLHARLMQVQHAAAAAAVVVILILMVLLLLVVLVVLVSVLEPPPLLLLLLLSKCSLVSHHL